jgi:arsenate reductase-like glutaredoxin family protein
MKMELYHKLYDRYHEKLYKFIKDIENISNEINYKMYVYDIRFIVNSNEYEKLVNYLNSNKIEYEDYNYDDKKMIIIKLEQFYHKAYDNLIKTIYTNVDRFFSDIDVINNRYKVHTNKYNIIFVFQKRYDKELYEKLVNHLKDNYIEYTEYKFGQILLLKILTAEFIYYFGV